MRPLKRATAGALSVGLLTAALLAGLATTATAKPVFHEVIEGSFTDQFECDGLELEVETTFRRHVLINRRGPDGLLHLQQNVSLTEVFTNTATGKTFTVAWRFLDQDHSVTDNEDGTFTIVIKANGRIQYIGPDGRPLFVDAGQFVFETVWADDGDFPSGGTELSRELVKNAGVSQTDGRDFCADLHELLT